MTEERMNQIVDAILAKGDEAQALFDMEPEAAAKELTSGGFPVTADELVELGEAVNKAKLSGNAEGELNESDLDDVAGGCWGCVYRIVKYAIKVIWDKHGRKK